MLNLARSKIIHPRGSAATMDKFNEARRQLESDLITISLVVQLQEATGIPVIYLVLGGSIVLSGIIYVVFGPGLVCNMVGFAYPAYASYKAIESDDKGDDTQWLTYWVVYAFFHVIETFVDFIVHFFQYYFAIKFGLLIWLFSPSTMGADFVYKNYLRPFLLANEETLDSYKAKVDNVFNEGYEVSAEVADAAAHAGAHVREKTKDMLEDAVISALPPTAGRRESMPPEQMEEHEEEMPPQE